MRTDGNKIALRALRSLLGGAKPFEVVVGETKVACSLTATPAAPWPQGAGGIDEASDGPWPSGVAVDCRWEGGDVDSSSTRSACRPASSAASPRPTPGSRPTTRDAEK